MRNKLFLKGQVVDEATFLLENHGEKIYRFSMRTNSLENFPIRISEWVIGTAKIEKGKEICIRGDLQSYFDRESGKICLFCLGDFWDRSSIGDRSFHVLHGYICKPPVYRTVDNAERACFWLSAERTATISDYIPCVAAGKDVELIKKIKLGEKICVVGCLQNRKDDQRSSEIILKTKRIGKLVSKNIRT